MCQAGDHRRSWKSESFAPIGGCQWRWIQREGKGNKEREGKGLVLDRRGHGSGDCRVYRRGGERQFDDCDDARGFEEGGQGVQSRDQVHSPRAPRLDDVRSARLAHSLFRSQPGAQELLSSGHGEAGHRSLHLQLSKEIRHARSRPQLPSEVDRTDPCCQSGEQRRDAMWKQRDRGDHDLHGLQSRGLGHVERLCGRTRPLRFDSLSHL